MEITQMRYFLEVARSQHMTESARRLHIAQPALSQSIRRLEESLGVPLFEPKGRGIVLTEYGRYLQDELAPIIDRLDRIPEALTEMARLSGGTVHLNVLAASTLVTSAVIDYKSEHSDVNFKLLQNTDGDVSDIEITTRIRSQSPEAAPEDSPSRFVCTERIFLAVPAAGKYSARDSITLREVEHEGFISLIGSRQFRAICDRFCHQAGIMPKIIFESDNPAAVRNMIAANLGIGFWPEFSWGQFEGDRVLLLPITDPLCARDIVITHTPSKSDSPHSAAFFEHLKSHLRAVILRRRSELLQ